MSARSVATDVLERVWVDDAFASVALDTALAKSPLDARDRGLATELCYGVLRTEEVLRLAIAKHANSDRWASRPRSRAIVMIGAYSILFLDRIPAFAAVSETVEALKREGAGKLSGFANAVLRKLATEVDEGGKRDVDAASHDALPRWLRGALEQSLRGRDHARAFLKSGEGPALTICLAPDASREAWLATLREAAGHDAVSAGTLSPRAITLRGAGDPRLLPGCNEAWWVQEEGAQAVALLLGARAGDKVLDACAGHGGKSYLLAGEVTGSGAVDAADLYPRKLDKLRAGARGDAVRAVHAVDWTRGSGGVSERYDRVIVDAPCSGVGTLRRRPEIVRRLSKKKVAELAGLQERVVRGAARHVEDGGLLLYAICSVLQREAEAVVEALQAPVDDGPTLTATPLEGELAQKLCPGATSLRLLPQTHGCDGYYVAAFRVSG